MGTRNHVERSTLAADVLGALSLVRQGHLYSLDCGRFAGMPMFPAHPPFQVLTYRTPRGIVNQGDQDWLGENDVNFHWNSEMVMGTVHSGTHVDAFAHITCGTEHEWFGGAALTPSAPTRRSAPTSSARRARVLLRVPSTRDPRCYRLDGAPVALC